ncbi:MAG: DUF2652 domain-containing protein [Chitinophagaceae bacterium]
MKKIPSSQHTKAGKGVILIPDIVGYTRFVRNTDVATGRNITYELLSSIIESNLLSLEVAEIEGDAIFFYRHGVPPSPEAILLQYEVMLFAFHNKLEELNERFDQQIDLSLKLVAHYGPIATYNIGGFKKLYGETVIEAHRLLKNSVNSHSYALITDELIAAASVADSSYAQAGQGGKLCEVFDGTRNICFTWFDYGSVNLTGMAV